MRRNARNAKTILAKALALTLILTMAGTVTPAPESSAAKKLKLSKKKVTVSVKKSVKIKVKNVKAKKVKKLTVKSAKESIATVKKNGKTKFTIIGKKAGKTTVTAKITLKGSKKATSLKVKVTVKKANTKNENTPAPTAVPTEAPTVSPSQTPAALPSSSPTAEIQMTAAPDYICNYDFEDGSVGDFYGRSNDGSVTVSVTDGGYNSDKAMLVSGRVKDWTGPAIDLSEKISECVTYRIHFYIRNDETQKTKKNFYLSQGISVETDDAESYLNDTTFSTAKSNSEWTEVTYDLTAPATWSTFFLYIETVYGNAPTLSFVIDDFSIEVLSKPGDIDTSLDSLKGTYDKYFDYFGMAVSYDQLMNENEKGIKGFLQKHFNSITMGNEMKPDAILQEASDSKPLKNTEEEKASADSIYVIPDAYAESTLPVIDFTTVDKCLKKASEDGYKLRFHTLVWHEQMPSFFFKEGYSASGDYVDEDTMYAREEMYIRTVLNHVLSGKYADVVYAVDVVNEYLNSYDESGEAKSTNYWAPIFGDISTGKEYVKKAFVWAYDELDKLGKTETISLFYNDYNTYYNVDKVVELINNINTVDEINTIGKICAGVGMQSHFNDSGATIEKFDAALTAFGNAGFEIQITELDVTEFGEVADDNKDSIYQKGAEFYGELMKTLLKHKVEDKANITSVTVWGLYDNVSWRSKKSPLLFGNNISDKKPSFDAVINAAKNFSE